MEDFSEINGAGTLLHDAQQIMVEILIEFDRVCSKNNLTYWIDFGSLLGAVRHGGFVPWDDDIDVSMPPADFRRFLEIGQQELEKDYFLQTEETDPGSNMNDGVFKIRRNGTLFINDFDDFRKDYHKGISIDVFEDVPYPTVSKQAFKFFSKRIRKSAGFFRYNNYLNFKNILCYLIYPIYHAVFNGIWNLICLCKKKDRELTHISRVLYGYPSLKTDIFPLSDILFEGHSFKAPHSPDARLKNVFGDYMTIPPKEKRRVHAKYICTDTSKLFVNHNCSFEK